MSRESCIGQKSKTQDLTPFAHVEPTKRAQQKLRDTVRTFTDRRLTRLPLPDIVGRLNRYHAAGPGTSTSATARAYFAA